MLAARRFALSLVLLGLAATLTTAPTAMANGALVGEPASAEKRLGRAFTPPSGALLSDPMIPGRKRLILNRVVRSVRNTAKGEFIRAAVWNYDDRAVTNALIDAHKRGVHVQVVVASTVRNGNWNRTVAALNANRQDRSFASRCRGGCRAGVIMHAKFVLFSRVQKASTISMVGSFNLTKPAGFRQWNDMVTTRDKEFYDSLVGTFDELRARRAGGLALRGRQPRRAEDHPVAGDRPQHDPGGARSGSAARSLRPTYATGSGGPGSGSRSPAGSTTSAPTSPGGSARSTGRAATSRSSRRWPAATSTGTLRRGRGPCRSGR